jgi:hypothetical protein
MAKYSNDDEKMIQELLRLNKTESAKHPKDSNKVEIQGESSKPKKNK